MKIVVVLGFALFAASPALAMDPTGVPQCDALLKRYEECSSPLPKDRVHAAQRDCWRAPSAFAPTPPTRSSARPRALLHGHLRAHEEESDIKDCMAK